MKRRHPPVCIGCRDCDPTPQEQFFRDWKSALFGAAFILGVLLFAGLLQGCALVGASRQPPSDPGVAKQWRERNADDLQSEDPPSLYCKQWPDACTNIYDA